MGDGAIGIVASTTASHELAQLVETFLANFPSPHTQQAYRRDFKAFSLYWKQRGQPIANLKTISKMHVIEYRDYLRSRYSPNTVNRRLASLSSLFQELSNAHWIESNPVRDIRRPKSVSKRNTDGFTDAEVQLLLRRLDAKNTPRAKQLHRLLLVLFYTGCRISEALNLRVADIQQIGPQAVIHVRGKGDKLRTLPLHPMIAEELQQASCEKSQNPQSPVFTITRDGVHKALKKLQRECGMPDHRSCHSTRRTLISNLLEQGEPLASVQKLAGHSSPTTTVRYNVRQEALQDNPLLRLRYKRG